MHYRFHDRIESIQPISGRGETIMIEVRQKVFRLSTKSTSYLFRILPTGHLENLHYGRLLAWQDFQGLYMKQNAGVGSSVLYEEGGYTLDLLPLEYSFNGKGDFREMPLEIKMPDGSYVCDFQYESHEILAGTLPMEEMPTAKGEEAETLVVHLSDRLFPLKMMLIYTVFPDCDVITRRAVIENRTDQPVEILKFMSMQLDLLMDHPEVLTLSGGWIREAKKERHRLPVGSFLQESRTGGSSNRHNPGLLLMEKNATEDFGKVYGFNLLYSGNHRSVVEKTSHGLVRIHQGVSPHNFCWMLESGETFRTPEAVMTVSMEGMNGVSHHFHDFINRHIISREFQYKERPVLMNNWEATFFDFNERKILSLAREAKKLGVELFVLDDGWFGERNSDKAGLGDYWENRKKLPSGIKGLAEKIKAMGLDFGLWFEPEMVNEDSDLYRNHPEYALRVPGRTPSKGRHQLVLDLNRKEVQDYIIKEVSRLLESCDISYVKWDMNRHMSDVYSEAVNHQGMAFHGHILGLYRVLKILTERFPKVLFESCSSGGNRFDLGMLSYMPQVWASDNTDPISRLTIQEGLSYFYPLSTIGAHVSESPHQQTLRKTPLETRFHVASFGVLGYELELTHLNLKEKEEVKKQIAWYKKHRSLMQFGRFYRFDSVRENRVNFQVVSEDRKKTVQGFFQKMQEPSPPFDVMPFKGLHHENTYVVRTREASMDIEAFGSLLKHVMPIKLSPGGLILRNARKLYRLPHNVEEYTVKGDLLSEGLRIHQQFMGTGYQKDTRMLGDFGSQLMVGEMKEER